MYLFSNKIKINKVILKYLIVVLDSYLKGGENRLGSE